MTDWIPAATGTHWFTSVGEALKFFLAKVRGIFTGVGEGDVFAGVGVEVEVLLGPDFVVGTGVGVFVVGPAVTSVRVHAEARRERQAPATSNLTTNRFTGMLPILDAAR
ncbi:MAG: hypothetical protein M3P18_02415 [Actinomycetota bacterium]|nr:hypothetical protein [Actinomycetota bacterium]